MDIIVLVHPCQEQKNIVANKTWFINAEELYGKEY